MDAFDSALMHLISAVAGTVVTAIWEGAVLAAGTAICLRLLSFMTAAARTHIWTCVFLLAVLLPLAPLVHSEASFAAPARPPLHVGFEWALILVGTWAMLSLYRGMQLLRSAYHLRGIAKRAIPTLTEEDLARLLEIPSRSFRRTAQLCSSNEVDVPSVVGFFSPRILLPHTLLERMSPSDLRQIVLHEMEHLRRNDDWTNLVQKLGLVLFPLNVVLLWVDRRMCMERELACDDSVLRSTGASKAYATCLANLAEQSLLRRRVTLALGAWQRQSELARRVHRILHTSEREIKPRWAALSAGLALAGVLGGAVVLTRAPQLIAFGGRLPAQVEMTSIAGDTPTPAGRASTGPHPTLVNAILPQRRMEKILPTRKRATKSRSSYVTASRHTGRTRLTLVLTRWQGGYPVRRITLPASEDSQFTFAAVPVRNGWLIIQL